MKQALTKFNGRKIAEIMILFTKAQMRKVIYYIQFNENTKENYCYY